jgi:hypothetical protein
MIDDQIDDSNRPCNFILTEPPELCRENRSGKLSATALTPENIHDFLDNLITNVMKLSGHVAIVIRSLVDYLDWVRVVTELGYMSKEKQMIPYIISYDPEAVS